MRTTSTHRRPFLLGLTFLLAVMLSAGAALAADDHGEAHTQDEHATTVQEEHGHGDDAHHAAAAALGEEHHDAHGHGDDHGHDPYHLPNFVSILFGEQLKGREAYLEPIYSAIIAVIGPTGRRYTPYLGTLFIFIWLNNLSGLVPLFHASTSVLNTTAALGICTFVYVQAIALKENGIGGYLFHMAGSPRSGVEWGIMPLMFVLHLTGEFIKPMSLSLRLFGNVMGEDKLLAVFVVLGAGVLAFTGLPIGIPFHVPIVFLALLTGTIQALVFTLLSMVYIALMLPHDEHHGEAHAH
jgi:F-type H+-transporting ATPase subunit a